MSFEKIVTPTLKELFVREIENKILQGDLTVGQQLPSERELAQQMKVSRSIVNAGINEMEARGFLEVRPRCGTFVKDYRRTGTLDTLISIMNKNGGNLRKQDVKSMLEIKLVLDKLAVTLLFEDPKADTAPLKELMAQVKNAKTHESLALAAFNFYRALAYLSGNILLPLMYNSFDKPILNLWARFSRKYGMDELVKRTETFFNTLEAGDREQVLAFMDNTLGSTIDGAMEIYEQ